LNLAASAAITLTMNRIPRISDPIQIEDTLGWMMNNLDRLAMGALIAAGIVAVMLVMRWIGHRILADDPEIMGWKGIVGRVLATRGIPFTRHAGNGEVFSGGIGSQGTQFDALGHFAFTLQCAQRVLRFLHHEVEPGDLLADMIDHRALLPAAERLWESEARAQGTTSWLEAIRV